MSRDVCLFFICGDQSPTNSAASICPNVCLFFIWGDQGAKNSAAPICSNVSLFPVQAVKELRIRQHLSVQMFRCSLLQAVRELRIRQHLSVQMFRCSLLQAVMELRIRQHLSVQMFRCSLLQAVRELRIREWPSFRLSIRPSSTQAWIEPGSYYLTALTYIWPIYDLGHDLLSVTLVSTLNSWMEPASWDWIEANNYNNDEGYDGKSLLVQWNPSIVAPLNKGQPVNNGQIIPMQSWYF